MLLTNKCILQCTAVYSALHYTVHCTVQGTTVYSELQCTVHCAVYSALQCMVNFNERCTAMKSVLCSVQCYSSVVLTDIYFSTNYLICSAVYIVNCSSGYSVNCSAAYTTLCTLYSVLYKMYTVHCSSLHCTLQYTSLE